MIFRKSSGTTETPSAPTAPPRPGAKGRPTRTRREAEAANRRPLVASDRREARRRSRQRASDLRAKQQQALVSGDEQDMPLQHRGRERRLVRDIVDSRRNIAEFFFPLALVVLATTFVLGFVAPTAYQSLSLVMMAAMWAGILLCVVDAFRLRRRLRTELTERFGEVPAGAVGYGVMRTIQIRRWRLPKPQVAHGETPRA